MGPLGEDVGVLAGQVFGEGGRVSKGGWGLRGIRGERI